MFFQTVYKSLHIFLPFCHNSRVWQTDGRTDWILIARPRLHFMHRGKNSCDKVIYNNTVLYVFRRIWWFKTQFR